MKEKIQKIYNPGLDILRIVSILAVVLIHTTTRTLEITHYDLIHFPWTLFLNQIARFAVPLFFMISGFSLELSYSSDSGYLSYFKKRVNRILIPYLFWSLIYYFLIYKNHSLGLFPTLLTGSASFQLYFIPTLFIFYVIFPIIHKIYRAIANKWVLFALGILEIVLLYYDYHRHSLPIPYPISVALFNYYVFILGMVASRHNRDLLEIVKKWKFFLELGTAFLAGFIFLEGRNSYLATYNYLSFYSQWRPSILIYTILLGSLTYYLAAKFNFQSNIIKTLSQLSFFVFFVHIIILENIWSTIGLPLIQQTNIQIAKTFWFDPLFFLIVTLLSFSVAYAGHKIPYLPKLTG